MEKKYNASIVRNIPDASVLPGLAVDRKAGMSREKRAHQLHHCVPKPAGSEDIRKAA